MTPRERWLALFNRQPVDRIPTDYTATPEVTARLLAELDCPDQAALWKLLHIDGRIEIEAPWKLPHHPALVDNQNDSIFRPEKFEP